MRHFGIPPFRSDSRPTTLWLPWACLLALILLASVACDSSEDSANNPTTGPARSLTVDQTHTAMSTSTPEATLPPTINPGPASAPPWQPDHSVARTHGASVAVHKVVISEDIITLLYSIELDHDSFHRTILVSPLAKLVGNKEGDELLPTSENILYHGIDVSLGALSFEEHDPDSDSYSLVITEMKISVVSDGQETSIYGPWVIPVIKQHERVDDIIRSWFPHQHWEGRAHSDRRDVSVRHNPVGYAGESSIGWIVTSGFFFVDRPVYVMVRPNGSVTEISKEWYENIDRLLNEIE